MRDRPLSDFEPILAARREEVRAAQVEAIGERRRIVLEIGCGHGHFLAGYAAVHTSEFCVGIDIASDRIRRGLRKRDRAKLTNLVFLRADARDFIAVLPGEVRIERIFILFPDPWPKNRHHKNRLLQSDFLSALAARSAPKAELYFRTDYVPYFQESLALFASNPDWLLQADASWPFEYTTVFQARAHAYQSLMAIRRAD